MKQVRWYLQCKKKDLPDEEWAWLWHEGIYDGWFPANGNESPYDTMLETLEEYRADYSHLDFRIVQEYRSSHTKVFK